jgi:hypothetical protein
MIPQKPDHSADFGSDHQNVETLGPGLKALMSSSAPCGVGFEHTRAMATAAELPAHQCEVDSCFAVENDHPITEDGEFRRLP